MFQKILPNFSFALLFTLIVIILSGCQINDPAPTAVAQNTVSQQTPLDKVIKEPQLLELDQSRSEFVFYVYRDGRLARLGHNHVIHTKDLTGHLYLHPKQEKNRLTVLLPVNSLVVDDPEYRSNAGAAFSSVPSESDKAATRKNLLGPKVLNAEGFPYIHITALNMTGVMTQPEANLEIKFQDRLIARPVKTEAWQTNENLIVSGELTLTHGELGLTPFSALQGALSVKDEILARYTLVFPWKMMGSENPD